ncbi:MAG: TRAP transporter small permease [Deltaproteobacteria bacterium]|nr:TRAP transporter small permease [Deltaproteobacteria bacterium]
MKKINDLLSWVCGVLVIIMLPVMTVDIFVQVVMRYVFSSPFMWAEEVARYLLVWISCLGSAYAVRKVMHINIVFVKNLFPDTIKTLMSISSHIIVMLFFVFCLYHGWIDSIEEWAQRTAAMQIPMTFPKLAIPVGFGLMVLFNTELLIEDIKGAFSGREIS